MIKHYIEWFYPGSFFSETTIEECGANRSAPKEFKKGAYGYRFFSRQEVVSGGEVLSGKATDYSPMTFFGKEYTLAEVKALNDPANRILISNMECNGYTSVVKTIRGNWQPVDKGDVVKDAPQGQEGNKG